MKQHSFPIHCLSTVVVLMLVISGPANAAGETLRTQVGRYITLAPTTTVAQRLPLLITTDIRLPGNVTWLRTAIRYVLDDSGYELAPDAVNCPEIQAIFERDVASVQRHFEQVTILEALHALAGPAFVIRLDPVSRLIAFDLAPAFRSPVVSPNNPDFPPAMTESTVRQLVKATPLPASAVESSRTESKATPLPESPAEIRSTDPVSPPPPETSPLVSPGEDGTGVTHLMSTDTRFASISYTPYAGPVKPAYPSTGYDSSPKATLTIVAPAKPKRWRDWPPRKPTFPDK